VINKKCLNSFQYDSAVIGLDRSIDEFDIDYEFIRDGGGFCYIWICFIFLQ
jgi:hypothetical protein